MGVAGDLEGAAVNDPALAEIGELAHAVVGVVRQPPSGTGGDGQDGAAIESTVVDFSAGCELEHALTEGDVASKGVASAEHQGAGAGFHDAAAASERAVDACAEGGGFHDERGGRGTRLEGATRDPWTAGAGNEAAEQARARVGDRVVARCIRACGKDRGRAVHPGEGRAGAVRIGSPLGAAIPSAASGRAGTGGDAINVIEEMRGSHQDGQGRIRLATRWIGDADDEGIRANVDRFGSAEERAIASDGQPCWTTDLTERE